MKPASQNMPTVSEPATERAPVDRPLRHEWSLYGVCSLFLIPSLYWIIRDQSVWPWDQSWYGEVSVDLWYTLCHAPASWPTAMISAFGSKAPGIAWLGQWFVPLGRWTQSEESSLLLSVLLAALMILVLTYKIGMELSAGRPEVAWCGVILTAGAPLFVALSHQYFVEMLQTLAVTYLFWIAASGWRLRQPMLVGHLLLAAAIGLLAKASTPLYAVFPGLIGAFWLLQSLKAVRGYRWCASERIFMAIGLLAAAATMVWYARNVISVATFVRTASSGSASLHYGSLGTLHSKLYYWVVAAVHNAFFPLTGLGTGVLLLFGIGLAGRRRAPKIDFIVWVPVSAGLEIALVLFTFSLQVSEEQRYLLPMIPSITIVLMWLVALVKSRPLAWTICLLAMLQCAQSHAQALGIASPNSKVAYWLQRCELDGTARGELSKLVRRTSGPGTAFRYNIVGIEIPWFNANSLAFYQAKYRLVCGRRSYFTSLGYAQQSVPDALHRIDQLHILYFTSIEENHQPRPPNFLNQVAVPVLKHVQADRHFVREPFASQLGILLFRCLDTADLERHISHFPSTQRSANLEPE